MKRGGSTLDNEPDKKKSGVAARTRSAKRAASFKLTHFASELLKKVCSYLDLKERQITRRVCQSLLQFVDESTPGADKLDISLKQDVWKPVNNRKPFRINMQPANDRESSVHVQVGLYRGRWYSQVKASRLQALLSSLPPLRSIRPEAVSLQIDSFLDTPIGLVEGIMQHMIEHQVSVLEMDVSFSASHEAPRSEVQPVFLELDRISRDGVQKLKLRGDSVNILLPTAGHFSRLVSLSVDLGSE